MEVTFESKVREKQITIRMFSDSNNILIGKQGKTLQALTTVVKQVVKNKTGCYPYVLLDVSNYKENQEKYFNYFLEVFTQRKRAQISAPFIVFTRRIRL